MTTVENIRELLDRPPMYRCQKYFDKLSVELALELGCSPSKVRHQIANDYGFVNYFDFCSWLDNILKKTFNSTFVCK
ncbi:hypothetical protein [Sigmofec virus UA08Rod_6051]|uniref:Uncharacterized protein n=1 Tax=Sigmofec virus UA08Rod_6051 TaxID=2929449 RepID=A0A976N1H0_9VIRU|nr:hypothetical protein [Sigmofec virus UA08Rod_6051]